MTTQNRIERLERTLKPRDDPKPPRMTDFPPTPRTVEEWNRVVTWHMGKSDGRDIEPDMKLAWEEWKTRHPTAGA